MDGRGPTIWDTFCHAKGRVFEDHTGDVACNSYQLWEEDLKCIQQLGLTHYRLSISWSRLLPDGTTNHLNPKGHVHQSAHLYHRKWLFPDGAGSDRSCRLFPFLSGHSAGSW
uniref:Glucosidase, beta, acid 3 (gene/pseudogene) n=1 Tax=Cyprinus carpio carpio TaxID=630221 RepID=A0A9J8C9D0_CYPCA